MKTDQIIGSMLDRDWTEADLELAAKLLREIEGSSEARDAVAKIDRVRAALANKELSVQPAGGWAAFGERMGAAYAEGDEDSRSLAASSVSSAPAATSSAPKAPAPSASSSFWQRRSIVSVFRVAAIQAAVIVVSLLATFWCIGAFPAPRPIPMQWTRADTEKVYVQMSPREVEQQVGLFSNVASVFDGRAKWVAVSDAGAAEMGLASTAMPRKGRLILLRIAVFKSSRLLSRSDLALVPGQDADITLPFENGQEISYRISATATHPTRLSLWAQVQQPGGRGQTLAALATELSARPGDLIKAGELNTTSGDYQFQLGVFEASQDGPNASAKKEPTP